MAIHKSIYVYMQKGIDRRRPLQIHPESIIIESYKLIRIDRRRPLQIRPESIIIESYKLIRIDRRRPLQIRPESIIIKSYKLTRIDRRRPLQIRPESIIIIAYPSHIPQAQPLATALNKNNPEHSHSPCFLKYLSGTESLCPRLPPSYPAHGPDL